MASSVSGVSNNNMSSIYGNRNVLSGLASGLDTESMIQNSVSGIKTKIANLYKQRTSTEWKQEGYRSILEKMVGFQNKYTSYVSNKNLLSPSFFNQSVITTTNGTNAAKVSATGKTTSTVEINSVTDLATAAHYSIDGSFLTGGTSGADPSIRAASAVDLSTSMDVSKLSGSMTIQYGSKSVSIDFDELETFNDSDGNADLGKLKAAIQKKLEGQKIVTSSGETVSASTLIGVSVDNGKFSFTDAKGAGNSVYISDAIGKLKDTLFTGVDFNTNPDGFTVSITDSLCDPSKKSDYLAGKELSITLDGVTKKVAFPTAAEIKAYQDKPENINVSEANAVNGVLQEKLNVLFGTGKITVPQDVNSVKTDPATNSKLQLTFSVKAGSTIQISSPVNKALGLEDNATSYVSTATTLENLKKANGDSLLKDLTSVGTDSNNNALYSFKINNVEVGQYTKDTTLETVLTDIRNNTEAGVTVSFSKTTNQFVFSAKETGATGDISFGDGLAKTMFGQGKGTAEFKPGTDAVFSATINGAPLNLTRSTNTVDLDGLSITLKDTFTDGEKVTFTTKSDSDKIVDAIKSMVNDYNEMVTEIKTQYSTLPLKKSNKTKYEPLTEEDKASMSETSITAYEKKAKQGLLFGDQDLSALYEKMRSAITPPGTDGSILRSIGIGTNYAQELTTLSLDENKLRSALESNPDQVRDAFTKTQGTGNSSTNGLMQSLKTQLDKYSTVTGAIKGILVQKAGTPLSPLSLLKNSLQDSISSIDKQIDRWEIKLSDQVDLYTRKFTQLEKLVSQMNSQSSALTGMLGG